MLVISGLLHLMVVAALLAHRRAPVIVVLRPGTAQGSRVTLTYSPGRSAAQAAVVAAHTPVIPMRMPAAAAERVVLANAAAAGEGTAGAAGGDSLGSGNVTVALPTYFPWPRPDLAELPHGSRGDVIVEVTIDVSGKIVESRLAQGLGQGIDANVLATIQAWTFKPATKDGVAIASEQELLFHYERG